MKVWRLNGSPLTKEQLIDQLIEHIIFLKDEIEKENYLQSRYENALMMYRKSLSNVISDVLDSREYYLIGIKRVQ